MSGAIRSELRKVFTTRMWWGLALGMALLTALISMGMAALHKVEGGFPVMTPGYAQIVYNAGLLGNFGSLAALFPLTLGVLLVTNEYRHQTVTGTYLATPRRWQVTLAKIASVVAVGLLYGIVQVVAGVLGGSLILGPVKGAELLLDDRSVLGSLGIALVATIVWTLLGYAFGSLVRNQIAALLAAIGVAFLGQILLNVIFAIVGWELPAKLLPGNLTTGMLVTSDPLAGTPQGSESSFFFEPWWVNALILVGYAAVLTAIGSILTARRDVT